MSRAYCYQCHKAKAACICGQSPAIENQTNIIVLQHPAETSNPKGSAIIAKLYLEKIQLWIGEDFSSHSKLNQLIEQYPHSTAVVYPGENTLSLDGFIVDSSRTIVNTYPENPLNLIFIDGNWRKARKIWHLSRNLHKLPCIKIDPESRSNYRIRKIPDDNYLSSIEAIHFCLSKIENDQSKFRPLLNIFNNMIDFQITRMGRDVYLNNYS
ncbi:MAG: DTW domain-containing protein [Gammaproteobacteria bacterium]|nr:DTW domain-containing protein [Gammaproteobacteria bacterium]